MSRFARDLLAEAWAVAALREVAGDGDGAGSVDAMRWRTVAGRAYFAAYHALAALAHEHGYRPDGLTRTGQAATLHRELSDWLAHHSEARFRHAGAVLAGLRLVRVAADYRPQAVFSFLEIRRLLDDVQALINAVCEPPLVAQDAEYPEEGK